MELPPMAFVPSAEQMLGMDDDAKTMLRLMVKVDLLLAHAGITEDQVDLAYEQRLRSEIRDVATTLSSLVDDGI